MRYRDATETPQYPTFVRKNNKKRATVCKAAWIVKELKISPHCGKWYSGKVEGGNKKLSLRI